MTAPTLLLMRHAKSAWPPGASDHDRPLKPRGQRDAAAVGAALRAHDLLPDVVLLSDSRRTRETLVFLEEAVGAALPSLVLSSLYHPGVDEVRAAIRRHCGDGVRRAMVLAHNPGLELATEWLSGEAPTLPTAAVVHLAPSPSVVADASWADRVASPVLWRMRSLWTPGGLSAPDGA